MRYKIARGGRNSAKSWTVARKAITFALNQCGKGDAVLCTRWIQKSLNDSSFTLIENQIHAMGLDHRFRITKTSIEVIGGCKFIFEGLSVNIENVKSMENIRLCIIEEANIVSREAFMELFPSIRGGAFSEIWIIYNPRYDDDAVHAMIDEGYFGEPNVDFILVEINYDDNPFFKEDGRQDMEMMKKVNHDLYLCHWKGQTIKKGLEGLIKRDWFIPFRKLPHLRRTLIIVDTAGTIKETSDYTAMLFVGEDFYGNVILLDSWRGKELANERYTAFLKFVHKHKLRTGYGIGTNEIHIENKLTGIDLIQRARAAGIAVNELNRGKNNSTFTGKFGRFIDILFSLSSGNTYYPEEPIFYNGIQVTDAQWVDDAIEEYVSFTSDDSHEHDDQTDNLIDAHMLLKGGVASSIQSSVNTLYR